MILANSARPPPDQLRSGTDLAEQLAMYRLMVENVADVIIRADGTLRRVYVSPAAREMLGYEPKELLGGSGLALVHPDDCGRARATLNQLGPAHPLLSLVFRMRRKDETYIWIEARYRHLPEDGGLLAVLRNITARKTAEGLLWEANERLADANRALQALADRDGLTGLAIRRFFDAQFAEEFRRAHLEKLPLALVLLDVDYFKLFNDHHGHLAGDDCLRRICGAVEKSLRRPGDIAARYGGEEIVVMLPATDEAGALFVAENIRQAVAVLNLPHPASPHGIVTVSAGINAMTPFSEDDKPSDLIAAADRALYEAKQAGRNRICATVPARSA